MRRLTPVLPLSLAGLALLLSASSAAAAGAKEAASTIATEIVSGITKAKGAAPELIMLSPLRAPEGDGGAAELMQALTVALVNQSGVPVVDADSVKAAIEEATTTMSSLDETGFGELAGAFGAQYVITGSIDRSGPDYIVNARGVDVQTGEVIVAVKATFSRDGDAPTAESMTLQVQLRRLSDRLAKGLEGISGELRYQQIAVLPFQEVGGTTQDKQLGLLISAQLTTLLRRDHELIMIEREQVARLLDQMALGQTGLVDPEQTTEFGHLAGAQGLIIGSVAEAGDRYMVNARVVGAETGSILVAEEIPLPAADLVALSSEAVVLRTRTGALYRSLLLPGWGQLYNRQPVKGGVFVAAEVGTLGAALLFHLRATSADNDYDKMTTGDFDAVQDRRTGNRTWRNALLFAALAVHAINVLDAFLSGKTFDTADVGGGNASAALFSF